MSNVATRRHHAVLALILSAGLLLNTYGLTFGLPHRWIVDETVAEALRVGAERSLVWGDITQTHFHTYLMTGVLAPYALYAQATRPDFEEIRRAAAVSWNELARVAPDFATRVTLIGRFFSALIGVATVFVVYLLGRRLFGVRAGLMAAAFLALSQGVVGSNHLARSEPLVSFFGALVLYLLVRALEPCAAQRRMFLTASFFAGLAFATKYNGLILVGSVGLTWLMLAWQDAGAGSPADRWRRLMAAAHWRWVPASAGLFTAGVLIGQPTLLDLLANIGDVGAYWGLYFAQSNAATSFAVNLVNYLMQLVVIVGVPFAGFLAAGIGLFIAGHHATPARLGGWLLLVTATAYLLTVCRYPFPLPWVKFIVFDVPLLAVFGGLALATLAGARRVPAALRIGMLVATFGYSAAYTFQVDRQLAAGDPRYATTRWIEQNIQPGSSLEHFQEESWLYSARILSSYPVIYVGRDSRVWEGSLFRQGEATEWRTSMNEYLTRFAAEGPSGDFVAIWLDDLAELDPARREPSDHPHATAMRLLLDERLGYRLVYAERAANFKVPSTRFPGVYYPASFWWNPAIDYTPTEIRLYARDNRPDGSG